MTGLLFHLTLLLSSINDENGKTDICHSEILGKTTRSCPTSSSREEALSIWSSRYEEVRPRCPVPFKIHISKDLGIVASVEDGRGVRLLSGDALYYDETQNTPINYDTT